MVAWKSARSVRLVLASVTSALSSGRSAGQRTASLGWPARPTDRARRRPRSARRCPGRRLRGTSRRPGAQAVERGRGADSISASGRDASCRRQLSAYSSPSAERSSTRIAMNGGTRTVRGRACAPSLPVSSAWERVGLLVAGAAGLVLGRGPLVSVGVVVSVCGLRRHRLGRLAGLGGGLRSPVGVVARRCSQPARRRRRSRRARGAARSATGCRRASLTAGVRLSPGCGAPRRCTPRRRSLRLDVGLERLGVGLDRREGVVVARDHGARRRPARRRRPRRGGPSCSGRRCTISATSIESRLPGSAQVGEQAGVAEVVDDLAAEADHQPGRRVRRPARA